MKVRLPVYLKRTATHSMFIAALVVISVSAARCEALFLFRDAGSATAEFGGIPPVTPLKTLLKLDEKRDLLIQCGKARFTLAYSQPLDQFKPLEQHLNPKREQAAAINGISLTASLNF